MSSLETRKIEPQSSTTVTLGEAGDTVAVPAGGVVKTNTVKDSGGNILFTSDGAGTLSSVSSPIPGSMTFISSQTASGSASISFTSGIDSTYGEYVFMFTNMNPATNGENFSFQVNAVGQTGYNEVMTTTMFKAYHYESGAAALVYEDGHDQNQGTAFQKLTTSIGNASDESASGELHLFAPWSTTYVKQFYARLNQYASATYSGDVFTAGYINVAGAGGSTFTTAISEVQFKMTSGNINAGTIALYGIT